MHSGFLPSVSLMVQLTVQSVAVASPTVTSDRITRRQSNLLQLA